MLINTTFNGCPNLRMCKNDTINKIGNKTGNWNKFAEQHWHRRKPPKVIFTFGQRSLLWALKHARLDSFIGWPSIIILTRPHSPYTFQIPHFLTIKQLAANLIIWLMLNNKLNAWWVGRRCRRTKQILKPCSHFIIHPNCQNCANYAILIFLFHSFFLFCKLTWHTNITLEWILSHKCVNVVVKQYHNIDHITISVNDCNCFR